MALTGLLLANAVPDRRVAEQLRDAGRDGDLPAADYPRSSYGSRVDGFTDCTAVPRQVVRTGPRSLPGASPCHTPNNPTLTRRCG